MLSKQVHPLPIFIEVGKFQDTPRTNQRVRFVRSCRCHFHRRFWQFGSSNLTVLFRASPGLPSARTCVNEVGVMSRNTSEYTRSFPECACSSFHLRLSRSHFATSFET